MPPIYEFIDAVNTAARSKWLAVVAKAATAASTLNGHEQSAAVGDMRELADKHPGVDAMRPAELQEAFEASQAEAAKEGVTPLTFASAVVDAAAVTVCKRTFGDLEVVKVLAPELAA